jgi:hypothetical protein
MVDRVFPTPGQHMTLHRYEPSPKRQNFDRSSLLSSPPPSDFLSLSDLSDEDGEECARSCKFV